MTASDGAEQEAAGRRREAGGDRHRRAQAVPRERIRRDVDEQAGQEAGVAANTIYWYFEDKDDVLVAVLSAVMADVWPMYQAVAGEPISERVLWIVRRLTEMRSLVTTVHARVPHSPKVAEWHNNFHVLTSVLFRAELEAAGVSPETVDAEVMIAVFTVEGLLMHTADENEQRTVCQTLASRWPSAADQSPRSSECAARPSVASSGYPSM